MTEYTGERMSKVQGLEDLNNQLVSLARAFDGIPIRKVCLKAAQAVAKAVRANIKRGPTGNLARSVQAVSGRKATKYGATAIARINAWVAPHAHLVEEGTRAYAGPMKIPLAAVSAEWWAKLTTAQRIQAGKRGYVFITKRTGAEAQHPFERGLDSSLGTVMDILRDGCLGIVRDRKR